MGRFLHATCKTYHSLTLTFAHNPSLNATLVLFMVFRRPTDEQQAVILQTQDEDKQEPTAQVGVLQQSYLWICFIQIDNYNNFVY